MHDVDLTYITSRGPLVLHVLEGRRDEVGRHRDQYRRALLRHAALGLRRACARTPCTIATSTARPATSSSSARACAGSCRSTRATCRTAAAAKKRPTARSPSTAQEIEFSRGLHRPAHPQLSGDILAGRGFGLEDVAPEHRDGVGDKDEARQDKRRRAASILRESPSRRQEV